MQNYKLKQKILKTKPAIYYRATHSSSSDTFIVKKLNKNLTWEEVLQSKSLTLCKNTKCRYIAKMKQIIKEENSFYCVMEQSQLSLAQVIKNDIERKDIFKISKQLIELMHGLYEQEIVIRDVRPTHLFMSSSKSNLKLYHFELCSQKDLTQLDLTQLQDMRYLAPEEVLTKKGHDHRSLMFTMGLIISQLILGQPLIKAKNKLEYIYQLTNLFPNEGVDRMEGSQHSFKQTEQNKNTFAQKMQQSQISPSFVAILQRMLKIDYAERIPMDQVVQSFTAMIQAEQSFHKIKSTVEKQNNLTNRPNKNQVDIEGQIVYEIQFAFQSKTTLSIIPNVFLQKAKGSHVLPHEQNVQDDGTQPVVIKQASSVRGRQLGDNLNLKKGVIQKVNQPPISSTFNINMLSHSKPISIPPLHHSVGQSPSNSYNLQHYSSHPAELLLNPHKIMLSNQNQHLKNSRSTKQTINTIKRPQLTNYALNQANLGIRVGMNNTLFSENNFDNEEFI